MLFEQRYVCATSSRLKCCGRCKCPVGRELIPSPKSDAFFSRSACVQVRFLELLGRGFEEVNRHAEALRFFERAIKLAEADPECGLPFMGYEGKAQALISLGKTEEARSVLESALAKAQSQEKRGHEAQLLILLGRLSAQTGNRQQALRYLEDAGQFATSVQFYRIEADAMYELAQLYRDAGDLTKADARATQGVTASQQVGDRYY